MKIYLASRYSRKTELIGRRDFLVSRGHVITSRWLDGDYPTDEKGFSLRADDATRARAALEDWADVMAADVVLSFTEEGRTNGRGGRHVEFGAALAAQKRCIIIGHREHIFHHLPQVEVFATWEHFRLACFPTMAEIGGTP